MRCGLDVILYHFFSTILTIIGIFLLNSALTVIKHKSNTHSYIWQSFTYKVIKFISNNNNNIVFLLLGNFAKSKAK